MPVTPQPVTAQPGRRAPEPGSGKQLSHRGGAVEALAAAVEHPGPAAQPVQIGGRQRPGQRIPDLAPGDPFAVAHDPAVLRVGGDPRGVLVRPGPRLADVRHDRRVRFRASREAQPGIGQQPRDVLGDAQRRRKPGGPDPGHARVAPGTVCPDLVVPVGGGGPQPGVGGGDLLGGQARQDPVPGFHQRGKPRRGGGDVATVGDVLGGGPEQHVAVHGGRDKHALGPGRGHRQQDRRQQRPGQLVEHDQLTAPRADGEPVPAHHRVDGVAVQPGGVHHPAAADHAGAGDDLVLRGPGPDPGDPAAQPQPGPGGQRLRGVGQRGGPRADDALPGDDQRAERARPELRLPPVQLTGADPVGVGDAVAAGLVLDRGQFRVLLGRPGDEQRPGRLDRYPGAMRVLAQ